MRTCRSLCPPFAVAIVWLSAAVALGEGRYTLEVPGDAKTRSVAVIDANGLTITDGTGRSFSYLRTPAFDSADKAFGGYFSREANQAIQWPSNSTGKFLIGDPQGRNFRESRMQIVPAGVPREVRRPVVPGQPGGVDPVGPPPRGGRGVVPPEPVPPAPGGDRVGRGDGPDRGDRFDRGDRARVARRRHETTNDLAVLAMGRSLTAASIDDRGRLEIYRGSHETWRRQRSFSIEGLVPGAPLAIAPDPRGGPALVYTVTDQGQLIELSADARPRVVNPTGFVPGAHLAYGNPKYPCLFLVDNQGRILQMETQTGRAGLVDATAGRYAPGAEVAITPGAVIDQVFAIDQLGVLASYQSEPNSGKFLGPEAIARGFPPGGHVTAAFVPNAAGVSTLAVAAVDQRGSLQAYILEGNGWAELQTGRAPLPPGAAVSLTTAADGLHISAVDRTGTWIDWFQSRRGLVPTEIGRGFPVGAPVVLLPHDDHLHAFCVDVSGRLVAASQEEGRWTTSLFGGDFDVAPRLLGRRIVPNAALPPVTVRLDNRHNEPLVVTVTDEQAANAGTTDVQLAPGGSSEVRLARDSGGTLEETWLVTLPNGQTTERVQQTPLPPQPRYRLSVAANRTTYQYIDRRKRPGPLKDFDLQTPVSLGTFRLPPGAELRDGDSFDVYREATARRNPGAAALDLNRP